MIARYVAPVRCVYSRDQAVRGYWDAAAALSLAPTVDLITVLVSHGGLETGNFSAGLWNCNVGNLKASDLWNEDYTCITVNEILKGQDGSYHERWFAPEGELSGKGGKLLNPAVAVPPGHPQTRMRAYPTLSAGIADKIRFLLGPKWSHCLEFAKRGDASGYVRAIRARGYFTAYAGTPDPCPYETSVIKLTSAYRPLVEKCAAGELSADTRQPVQVNLVADGSAERTNPLDPETIARIEMMTTLWLDEQMHPPESEPRS